MAHNMMQNQFQNQPNISQQSQQQKNLNFSPKPDKRQQQLSSDGLQLNLSEQSEEYI